MGDFMKTGEAENEKLHNVTLDSFMIAKYELTNEEFERFCKVTQRKRDKVTASPSNHPVVYVSWEDALAYCNWLSIQHGLKPVYDENYRRDRKANGYRLPTEAEWEFAARQGGLDVLFGNGQSAASIDYINFIGSNTEGEERTTLPVDALNSPNSLGLYHMSGNVWEWCWDRYERDSKNPEGPSQDEKHVLRGGSFYSTSHECEVFFRNKSRALHSDVGFRLARNAK